MGVEEGEGKRVAYCSYAKIQPQLKTFNEPQVSEKLRSTNHN